jgi:hypothetical protein
MENCTAPDRTTWTFDASIDDEIRCAPEHNCAYFSLPSTVTCRWLVDAFEWTCTAHGDAKGWIERSVIACPDEGECPPTVLNNCWVLITPRLSVIYTTGALAAVGLIAMGVLMLCAVMYGLKRAAHAAARRGYASDKKYDVSTYDLHDAPSAVSSLPLSTTMHHVAPPVYQNARRLPASAYSSPPADTDVYQYPTRRYSAAGGNVF